MVRRDIYFAKTQYPLPVSYETQERLYLRAIIAILVTRHGEARGVFFAIRMPPTTF